MAYPDTNQSSGEEDALYGGDPSNDFGQPAWDFIHLSLDELKKELLRTYWRPYVQRKMLMTSSGVAGDVVVDYLDGPGSTYSLYTIAQLILAGASYDFDNTPRVGILAEPVSAGAKALVITTGPGIPPSIHGLAAGASGSVAFNPYTGRLYRATGAIYYYGSELVVAKINAKGYVHLLPRTTVTD